MIPSSSFLGHQNQADLNNVNMYTIQYTHFYIKSFLKPKNTQNKISFVNWRFSYIIYGRDKSSFIKSCAINSRKGFIWGTLLFHQEIFFYRHTFYLIVLRKRCCKKYTSQLFDWLFLKCFYSILLCRYWKMAFLL